MFCAVLTGCVERVHEGRRARRRAAGAINEPTPAPASAGKTEVRLFTWTPVDELSVNQELVKEFESQHPEISVEIVNVPGSQNPMQKLETMFAAKNAPDVISIHGAFYIGFAEALVLEDLGKFAESDADFALADFHPRLVDLCRYEGALYSLPRYTSVYSLFYNKDAVRCRGLVRPGSGSWTWNDYLKTAKALTRDLDGDGTPDQWGCVIDFWGARLYPWLWSNDADLMDRFAAEDETGAAATGLPLRIVDAPNVIEVEPNQKNDNATRGELPAAFCGVIEKAGRSRSFPLRGEEGRSLGHESHCPRDSFAARRDLASSQSQRRAVGCV